MAEPLMKPAFLRWQGRAHPTPGARWWSAPLRARFRTPTETRDGAARSTTDKHALRLKSALLPCQARAHPTPGARYYRVGRLARRGETHRLAGYGESWIGVKPLAGRGETLFWEGRSAPLGGVKCPKLGGIHPFCTPPQAPAHPVLAPAAFLPAAHHTRCHRLASGVKRGGSWIGFGRSKRHSHAACQRAFRQSFPQEQPTNIQP